LGASGETAWTAFAEAWAGEGLFSRPLRLAPARLGETLWPPEAFFDAGLAVLAMGFLDLGGDTLKKPAFDKG
jgi:hypothetical protein